jgi:hypothetical protein
MPKAHAKLSPSAAARWINCPGSVALSELCPPPGSSDYADEGTLAHLIAEHKVLLTSGEITQAYYDKRLANALQSQYYCGEMDEATTYYMDTVMEIYCEGLKKDKAAELMVEQRFDLGSWVPECFGTADAVMIAGDTIEVIDLKYGKGVRVDATGNPQLRLYGLGAAAMYGDIYDLKKVRMTIIQPRLDHVSTEEMGIVELYSWADMVVRPAAHQALGKDAPLACGDWCRCCPAKATCRKRAEANLELARYEFQKPPLLQPDEIGEILREAEELQKWAADVQAYALEQALQGEHFDGWKLVEGRSVRKYADDLKVAETLIAAGYDEALLYERKLLGLTAMEKLVGKKKLTTTLGDLIVKPAGKPVLVPLSDKREEISTTESAREDFKDA